MIDTHAHVLPCIDPDGPQSIAESIAMARQAWEDGVKVVFATPHIMSDRNNMGWDKKIKARDRLNEALRENEIGLEVRLAGELYFTERLESFLETDDVFLDESRKHFLVEFPLLSFPDTAYEILSRTVSCGMLPIIAHIERNLVLSRNRLRLDELVGAGCLLQLTGGSLLGYFGNAVKEKAEELLRNGSVHFLASDAHDSLDRPLLLKAALEEASKLIGDAEAGKLVHENPMALIGSSPGAGGTEK